MGLWKNKERTAKALFFLLATCPLIFGARHPFIQGLYTFLILLSAGGWFVFHPQQGREVLFRRSTIAPAVLLFFVFVSWIPLPIFLVELLSPLRAEYLNQASLMAQLKEPITSLSYYAAGTKLYSIYLLALFFFYFSTTSLLRNRDILLGLLWIVTGVGAVEAVYGLAQALIPSLGVLWVPSEVGAAGCARGTIIYRNQFASFMNMCWPLSLTLGVILFKPVIDRIKFRRRMKNKLTRPEKIAIVFQKATIPLWASLFMLLAVIFSRSRGGIIVMFIIAGLLLFFLPLSRRVKSLTGALFAILISIYGGLIGFHSVIERFTLFYEGAMGRITVWLDSLNILKDHLVTGIGMGAYQYLTPVYLHDVPGNLLYDYAHNEYVELAIELGLPMSLLLFSWMLWGMIRFFPQLLGKKKQSKAVSEIEVDDNTLVALGAYCALTGFLLHGFVDFTWRLPVNLIYAVTLLSLVRAALPSRVNTNVS